MKKFLEEATSYVPFALYVPAMLWQVLFLAIPILLLIYFSFHMGGDAPLYVMTFKNFVSVLDVYHLKILARTVTIAILVATVTLFLAFPVAYYIAMYASEKSKTLLLFLATFPFWTNFLIQVYSWFSLLDKSGLINRILINLGIISEPLPLIYNLLAIIIVMVYCYLPFMLLPLYSSIEKLSPEYLEASMDLGASWLVTFWYITVPLCFDGIKTGFLLVLVPVFGEFAIPSIIGGARYMFSGSVIMNYFLVIRDMNLGAAFTITASLLLLTCVCTLFAVYVIFRSIVKRILEG